MKVVTGSGEFDLGTTETTPTIGMTDFSRRVTDDFGVTTVVERGFSRRMSVKLGLPFDTVDAVQRRLSDLRAAPALWVADDRFVWLSLYGFYKDFDLDLASPPLSRCTLSIDGLAETGGVTDNGADPALGQTSTLQLLQPVLVTDAMLVSSLVAENDAPAWLTGTGYAKGARVIRASTHRVYESLITGNTGKTPEAEPAWWLDLGPTNRWAMFDQALGTATTRNGGVEVTLNGGTANAVSLIDLVGDAVRVRANGYDQTQAVRPGAMTFTGLPGTGQVIVTVSGAQAAVGTLLIGRIVGLGVTEAAPTAGITDFSRKETDDFGAVSVVQRGYLKRMTARALIRTDALDLVADRIAKVRARPSLWIGQSGVDAITVYGFVKDFEIEVGTAVSKLSLTVEGLTKAAPIATTVAPLVPRGPYNAATIYADGALVEDQGVTWRYINATPTSGYAPPTLPTTSNAFWQVFASTGMTPEQQAEYDRLVAALAALTSDNIIAAGGEKNQIIQLYAQIMDESARARAASLGLSSVYGGDPTQAERAARDAAVDALNAYLAGLTPAWDNAAVDTPADGPTLRAKFSDAQAATNQLVQANSAVVRDRAKVALDRAVAIGSDNVLSAGSEKQQTVIDWNTLYQDLESLYAKYVTLGSPSDLTAALNAASAARAALGAYLVGLDPAWNQISTDTPIVSATWSSKWTDAYQRINDLRAQITGRKGDTGATGAAGASAFTLEAGEYVLAGNRITRVGGDSWGTIGRSVEFYPGLNVSWQITQPFNVQVGLTDRTAGYSALYMLADSMKLFHSSSGVFTDLGSYALGDRFSVAHLGSNIEFRRNGILLPINIPLPASTPTSLWLSFQRNGAFIENVTMSRAGAPGRDGLDGTDGLNGTNGQSIHIAFADSADGTINFTTGAGGTRAYIGVYTDTNPGADSEIPAAYGWTLIKGADGKNGLAGPGGYVHLAYANSADGQSNFHLSDPTGRTYLGTYTDQTEADSTNPAAYAWSLIKGADGVAGADGFSIETTTTFNQQVFSTGANKPSWTGGSGVIRLLKGGGRVTDGVTYDVINNSGVAGLSISGDTFTFSGAVDDVGAFTVRAIYNGQTYEKVVAVKKVYDGEAAFKGATNLSSGNGSASMTVPAGRQCVISGSAQYSITGSQVGSYQATMSLYWRNKTDNGPSNFLGSAEGSIATSKNVGTSGEPVYERQPGSVSAAFSFVAPSPSKEIEYIVVTNRTAGNVNANVLGSAGMEVRS